MNAMKRVAEIAAEDTPLNHEVVQRCDAACDQARANHARYAPKPQTDRRNS